MSQRLPLILSVTALAVVVFGSTPLGEAAGNLARAVPPFAKRASFATTARTADNAKRLAGHTASRAPRPGQIPIVGPDGKLAASLGATGVQGPAGAQGPAGPKGDKGSNGATNVVVRRVTISGTGRMEGTASCMAGERATGGGFFAGGNGASIAVLNSYPTPNTEGAQPTGWHVDVIQQVNGTAPTTGSVSVICAAP